MSPEERDQLRARLLAQELDVQAEADAVLVAAERFDALERRLRGYGVKIIWTEGYSDVSPIALVSCLRGVRLVQLPAQYRGTESGEDLLRLALPIVERAFATGCQTIKMLLPNAPKAETAHAPRAAGPVDLLAQEWGGKTPARRPRTSEIQAHRDLVKGWTRLGLSPWGWPRQWTAEERSRLRCFVRSRSRFAKQRNYRLGWHQNGAFIVVRAWELDVELIANRIATEIAVLLGRPFTFETIYPVRDDVHYV